MSEYQKFLEKKKIKMDCVGFDVEMDQLNPMLFDWQKVIVKWAIARGRAALFADCGLGKTPMQLEWASQITGRVLILAPLAVAEQTCREAKKFGIEIEHQREPAASNCKIIITNYEKLYKFNSTDFDAIVLDESSILKSFDGTTRKQIQDFAKNIKYRLACTATPAPNDLIELCNHAEFLNVASGKEIIALFFKQDGNTTHQYRLKGHAHKAFYQWLAEWSVAIRKPSDIGYDDGSFKLPELNITPIITGGVVPDGFLFSVVASTMDERRSSRKNSLPERVKRAADLVNESTEKWLIWCDLNAESELIKKSIPGCIEVKGSDSVQHKESSLLGFANGDIRVMVSKPSIAGFGMNFQVCHNVIFVGLSDSYEQYYQAIRRCWRFGQKKTVNCYIITSESDDSIVNNIRRKEKQASDMFNGLVKEMSIYTAVNKQQRRSEMEYQEKEVKGNYWTMMLGDSCERIKELKDDSVGLTVFSPPFPGMYAYTNSSRDIGNSKNFTELLKHFDFLIGEILRITMPGRMCCIHLTQEPVFKGREGFVGLRDFRGDLIRAMSDKGWHYYSEVTIDKNPMLKASRTKEATLLFKTLSKDSAGSRPALADYLLIFKKHGDNPIPIAAGRHQRWNPKDGWITADEWCEWAAPVWYRAMPKEKSEHQPWQGNYPSRHQNTDGISEMDVLSPVAAREQEDEKHLCPLQLGVIERCIKLWSAPRDLVFSPFGGIGSEGYQAVKYNRQYVGIELKESYWKQACINLRNAENDRNQENLI
jgi:DNA modification methylase/superfamily II DNA or RNA helicase